MIKQLKLTNVYIAGDVGGVLGLFLGASAFTLIEFVFFIAAIIWSAVVRVFRCKESSQN